MEQEQGLEWRQSYKTEITTKDWEVEEGEKFSWNDYAE